MIQLRVAAALFLAVLAAEPYSCADLFPDPPGKRKPKQASEDADEDEDEEPEKDDPGSSRKSTPKPKPSGKPAPKVAAKPVPKGVVDLGVAVYPNGTSPDGPADYTFNVPTLAPSKYRLGYRLGDDEATEVERFWKDFAKSVGYKRLGKTSFQWTPPPGCTADLTCVYNKLVKRTRPDVVPIAKSLRKRAEDQGLSPLETAQMMLAFVQVIPYANVDDPFGVKPPPEVAAERRGDCDSKALLYVLLLESAGIEGVIVGSDAHAHAMAGVRLTTPGKSFDWRGRRYAFAETTAVGMPLGQVDPKVMSPNDWRVEWSAR